LDGKEDIRSSYYLEDVATEFQCKVSNCIELALQGMKILDTLLKVGNAFLLWAADGITLIKPKENYI
jgi:hypothetical protein